MTGRSRYIAALFTLLGVLILHGQSRDELEKKLAGNRADINSTIRVLENIRKKQSNSLQALTLLEEQIKERSRLLDGLNRELDLISHRIQIANQDILVLNNEITEMKSEFSVLLYQSYKIRQKQSALYFILSSQNFNQAFRRLHYLRELVRHRKKQLGLIVEKQKENSGNVLRLIQIKNSKLELKLEQESARDALAKDQESISGLLGDLKDREKELHAELSRKRKLEQDLEQRILAAIAREVEEASKKRKNTESGEAIVVRGTTFDRNKGQMPWPVVFGRISQKFGLHQHPKLKNITTENNGINILTADREKVRCVFDGVVSAVLDIPGMNHSVLVKHDKFFTVYANLHDIKVQRGQVVNKGEVLGEVRSNEEGVAELHFEVWQGSTKLNPEDWLKKQR